MFLPCNSRPEGRQIRTLQLQIREGLATSTSSMEGSVLVTWLQDHKMGTTAHGSALSEKAERRSSPQW